MSEILNRLLQAKVSSACIEASALPGLAHLQLYLIAADFPQGKLPADEMSALLEAPPYWSFCWGAGLAMAQFLDMRPQVVAGKRVLDFGCGSGVTAVAAKLAGASEVVALDLDGEALQASRENARLNKVQLNVTDNLASLQLPFDVLLASDVLYDRDNFPLLAEFRRWAKEVYIADSRVPTFPDPAYQLLNTLPCCTFPDLGEHDEFSQARIWYCPGDPD